jgi:N-methylhydantoinase A
MLEIARQMRPSLYNLRFEKPRSLVPRHRCFEVSERLDARGRVLDALDEAAVAEVAESLQGQDVEAVAVCLLHSYVNPAHEARVGELLRQLLPDAIVSLSSDIAPEFREYYRASTTVINAAIGPIVARYVLDIEEKLRAAGLETSLLIMQSNGGVYASEAARVKPVYMVESGPAAGVIAATHLGATVGAADLISFDMGGTTAKVCLIQEGTPRVTKDYEVGGTAAPGTGSARGSGYPIRTPVIDLVEIGAGGGSVAWVDVGGILRVGPQSAGADPGPVCYQKGGTEPTVTDANLVLGRLNPGYLLGGGVQLDAAAAREAIEERCARPLGLDVVTAANGIVEIANTAMVNALRLVSVQHGYDPRDFMLVAFGGAGPVHANRLAAETEIGTTLVPLSAGTTSAMGLLVTDLKREYTAPVMTRADSVDQSALEATYIRLEGEGRKDLEREGVSPEEISFSRHMDMRYVGQSFELTVELPGDDALGSDVAAGVSAFHEQHERVYGHNAPGEPVEFVNSRLTAIGRIAKPRLREIARGGNGSLEGALKSTRPVYFSESGGFVDCPVYDRYDLQSEIRIEGPAIIEEFDTTTVLHPAYSASVDEFGNLLIRASVASDGAAERVTARAGAEHVQPST